MRIRCLAAVTTVFSCMAFSSAWADVSLTDHQTLMRRVERLRARESGTPQVQVPRDATQRLIDASGLEWFINTQITYATSSSASGAASEAMFVAPVSATTANGELVSSFVSDAFDGYGGLFVTRVGGPRVTYNMLSATSAECGGRQLVFPVLTSGPLQIRRKVFVPSNDSFARWLNIITNTGSSLETIIVDTSNNLGSDAATTIVRTSSGDALATVDDDWVTTMTAFAGGTSPKPRLAHVMKGNGGAVGLSAVSFANGDDNPTWQYLFPLPAGQTVTIMTFASGQPTKVAAEGKALELARPSANAVQCMTTLEQAQVANFAVDSGTLQFTSATFSAAEQSGLASVSVSRVGGTLGAVTVDYAASGGTALAGSDFTVVSGTLPFADGEVTKTFVVPIIDDTLSEPLETINLTLSNPQGPSGGVAPVTLGTPSAAALTIVDDESPANITITSPTTAPSFVAADPLVNVAGTAAAPAGVSSITWVNDKGGSGAATGTTSWTIDGIGLSAGLNFITVTLTDANGATYTDSIAVSFGTLTYYLPEGATGPFFDLDVAIGNPNLESAPVILTFLKPDGSSVTQPMTLPQTSRTTIHVDSIPGVEATELATLVTSTDGLPLVVEGTMLWDSNYYGSHSSSAVDATQPSWFFAEGSQGFFDTFVLLANPEDLDAAATVTFFVEGGAPVVKNYVVGGHSRLTVWTRTIPELADKAFSIGIESSFPILVARSMYFGNPLYNGGAAVTGNNVPSTTWFHAEGATGSFFDTYILMGNPNPTPATVTMTYLPETGPSVVRVHDIAANSRLTVNIEDEAASLTAAGGGTLGVSVSISSTQPIVSERSMYWPGNATTWSESHASFGVPALGTKWALGEGRVGGPRAYETYILLANPGATAAIVRITYLRADGSTVEKQYVVAPNSRFNVYVNGVVPELFNEEFAAIVESLNSVPIAVERSTYSPAFGQPMAAGSNSVGVRVP